MEERITQANPTTASPQNLFLSYYFKSVAKRNGQSIKCFLRPSLANIKKKGPRSFNSGFMQAIGQSKLFLDDLHVLLSDEFLPETGKIMFDRLFETVTLWEKCFHKDPINAAETICNKLDTSPKLKIPWSIGEVVHARDAVVSALRPEPRRRRVWRPLNEFNDKI